MSFPLGIYPEVQWPVDLFLTFEESIICLCNNNLYTIVVGPVYIPISQAQLLPFLHTLTNTYLLSS